ncbi:MAG: hypothetical protein JWO02_4639, partial [Solirubrobacterales bacterium]|nr:hypothetical protein [Solirubrobacterales bacterium]
MTGHGDVSSTLADLERKLKDLERELASIGAASRDTEAGGPATSPQAPESPTPGPSSYETLHDVVIPAPALAPVPAAPVDLGHPAAGQIVADAQHALGGLHHQLEDLVRFREHLERSTRELIDEYSRLLDALPAPGTPPVPLAAADALAAPPASPPAVRPTPT